MNSFRQFYCDNRDKLFGYLLRKSGSAHLAADLVQESFTRYFERYRAQTWSVALLFTIARNSLYDHARDRKRASDNFTQSSSGWVEDEERLYIVREETRRVLAAMQKLDEEDRDMLSLVVTSGLNYREIAAVKECSEAAVKVRVHRARQQLRKLLSAEPV